MITIVTKELPY